MAIEQFKITTVSGDVTLDDLGERTFTHPTVDYDMLANEEFTMDELKSSQDLNDAIDNGELTVKNEDDYDITHNPFDFSLDVHDDSSVVLANVQKISFTGDVTVTADTTSSIEVNMLSGVSLHDLDDPAVHDGITGDEDNLMEIDENGLPRDSGIASSDVSDLIEIGFFVPDSTSAADIDVFYQDPVRDKILGLSLLEIGGGRDGSLTNSYLRTLDGSPMNLSSDVLPWDATLVGISCSGERNNQTWTAQIRKNGAAGVIDSLTVTNAYVNSDMGKDTDFSQDDRIQIYISGTAIKHPQVRLFFRRLYT